MSGRSMALQTGISWILRIGVVLSVLFDSAGILLNYAQTGSDSLDLTSNTWKVAGGNFFDFAISTVRSLFSGLTPLLLVSVGVVTLMFTPYVRVIAAVVYYGIEKDWKYVAITSFVLVVITAGLLVF